MIKSIKATELSELMNGGWSGRVLHLQPEDHFRERHLKGANLACVYEVSFTDQTAAACAGLDTPLVLYTDGPLPFAVEAAAAKLTAAGYTDVRVLEGGLGAWLDAGLPIESEPAEPAPRPSDYDGLYTLNTAESLIRWTGRNLFNHHEGTLRLGSGSARIADGLLKEASFSIDMKSIANTDLTDPGINAMLLRHLADTDFFDTARFPTAEFWLGAAVEIPDVKPGVPNYEFTGLLRLRGVTQEISFPVVVAANGLNRISAQAQVEIDRTRWGVLYGSSRFFDFLGKHVVNDAIHLHLKMHLDRL